MEACLVGIRPHVGTHCFCERRDALGICSWHTRGTTPKPLQECSRVIRGTVDLRLWGRANSAGRIRTHPPRTWPWRGLGAGRRGWSPPPQGPAEPPHPPADPLRAAPGAEHQRTTGEGTGPDRGDGRSDRWLRTGRARGAESEGKAAARAQPAGRHGWTRDLSAPQRSRRPGAGRHRLGCRGTETQPPLVGHAGAAGGRAGKQRVRGRASSFPAMVLMCNLSIKN